MATSAFPAGRAGPVLAACVALLALCAGAALGQDAEDVEYLPRDTFTEQRFQEGNAITFCYNSDGMMAAFEQDVARAIGETLLIEARTVPVPEMHMTTPPLDHRIPIMPVQLYILLAQHCSGLIGYALAPNNLDWLHLTQPYMSSRYVLVAAEPSYRTLADVPYDRPIGSRGLSVADNRLINFLAARPEGQRWHRFPYYTNDVVLERVLDGTTGAGLIWEPGLYYATDGDPEAAGLHVLEEMPFEAPPVEIGIATRSDNTYLNNQLSEAIAALVNDGTIDALMRKHNLLPVE